MVITQPGVYSLPEEVYHGDPVPGGSLSASGAKLLVPPSTPAHFHWAQTHPQPHKKVFDLGGAAHSLVLGVGAEPIAYPDKLLATNGAASTAAAKQWADDQRAEGKIPLKRAEVDQVLAMAEQLRRHPIAGRLFEPGRGAAEQSMFWADPEVGITRRARLDWLPTPASSGRLIIPDYKTAVSAEPAKWIKASTDYGVHMQHANYVAGAKALGLAEDVAFVFVVQEKTAPYLVSVVEVDPEGVAIGHGLMRLAARRFAEGQATGHWPGYGEEVHQVSLPAYYINQIEGALP